MESISYSSESDGKVSPTESIMDLSSFVKESSL